MPRVVRELGVMLAEYYNLPSTDDCLDLSQRGIQNEGKGSVPRKGGLGSVNLELKNLCAGRILDCTSGTCHHLKNSLHVPERNLCCAMDSQLLVHHHCTLVSSSEG